MNPRQWFGSLGWLPQYNKDWFASDALAALVVTVMLIPQSLAYALLAGLPAHIGLYASIAPLLAYAVFGSSRTLAVGPVAVASLMSAQAAGQFAEGNVELFYQASVAMALIGGLLLMLLGFLRAGFVSNMLSHPVVSAFVTGSALLIALGQVGAVVGIQAKGETFVSTAFALFKGLPQLNLQTTAIGLSSLLWLWSARKWGRSALQRVGLKGLKLELAFRAAPVVAIVASSVAVLALHLEDVKTVGAIPSALPQLMAPKLSLSQWVQLLVPAMLIALVGFVETVSVGHALASKRRQKIDANQELLGLGAANLASGAFGGFSVTGGFSRSVVNFDAGAQTPMAGVMTAGGILAASLFLTPALTHLPKATLAATIILAVWQLIDWHLPKMLKAYSPQDFKAYLATLCMVLLVGVEAGIVAGVLISLLSLLAAISKPHHAVVGQVEGTEHFRNVKRHAVNQHAGVLSVRIDESLYFPNARWLEETVLREVADKPDTRAVVLQCNAINHIDASALEALIALDDNLKDQGVVLYFSELKGPVTDRLMTVPWYQSVVNRIGLTHLQAVELAQKAISNLPVRSAS